MGSLSTGQLALVIAKEIQQNIVEKSQTGHVLQDTLSAPKCRAWTASCAITDGTRMSRRLFRKVIQQGRKVREATNKGPHVSGRAREGKRPVS